MSRNASRRYATGDPPVHRVTGPAELLQAVPYLLGFQPAASVVLVGLRNNRLVVTARVDLVDAVPAVLTTTVAAMTEGGSGELIAAVYDDDAALTATHARLLPRAHLVTELEAVCGRAGVRLRDCVLVSAARWRSYRCAEPSCCGPGGSPMSDTTSSFAAAATLAGRVPLPDRDAVAAQLDPASDDVRQALVPLLTAAEDDEVAAALAGGRRRRERATIRALFAAARAADEPRWAGLPDPEVARFGVALGTTAVRDSLWMGVDDGRIDGRPLWRELARRLPSPRDAAPLFLFGWTAWRAGDGALANIAAERATASDPCYTAADLLIAALSNGIDPQRLPRLRPPRTSGRAGRTSPDESRSA